MFRAVGCLGPARGICLGMTQVSKGLCWQGQISTLDADWRNGSELCGDATRRGIAGSKVRQRRRTRERLWDFSDARFVWFWSPQFIVFDQRVQDREEFSHGCHECHFLLFSFSQQSLVKGFDSGIESCGDQRGHV